MRFIALGGIVKVPQTSNLRHFRRFSFFAQSRYHRTSSFARKRNSEPFSTAYSVPKILFRHAEHKGKALCKITIFAAVCFYFFDGGKRKFKMRFKHWHFWILPIAF